MVHNVGHYYLAPFQTYKFSGEKSTILNPILTEIWGCFRLTRSPMLELREAETLLGYIATTY